MASAIKTKMHNISSLMELYKGIEPSELQIPAMISEHDISINGCGGFAYELNHHIKKNGMLKHSKE
jgi:hypothetical protein